MATTEQTSANTANDSDAETCSCCIFPRKSPKKKEKDDETKPLIRDKPAPKYGEDKEDNQVSGTVANDDSKPMSEEARKKNTPANSDSGTSTKVEKIEMKLLHIQKVDDIFKKFEETFNSFSASQKAMVTAVKEFQTAVKAGGAFKDCLREFKRQVKDNDITMKKVALKIPNTLLKSGGMVGSAATALMKILEAFKSMEGLPVKVTDKSISCVKEIMELDPKDIVSEEFSGSVFDLGKIPEQMTNIKNNLKEIKKAPKIVKSFFQYATSIVMQIAEVFGNEKTKEEISKAETKVCIALDAQQKQIEEQEEPKPPKEVNFKSLHVPTVDMLFTDVGRMINPVAKLGKDLYEARSNLEKAMKAISKFREDEVKAFNDYLNELKERIKKGEVHITITTNGNRVEVTKVEGLEPVVMKNIQSGLKALLKSCNEIENLGPDTVRKLPELIKDISKVSPSDVKSHVSFKEIPATISALNENTKAAKQIPAVLKFFMSFVRNLIMDILDVLHAGPKKDDETSQTSEDASPNTTD